MVQSIQNTPKCPEMLCPTCPSQVNEAPSLNELFQYAQDLAKDFQDLVGKAGVSLENKANSIEKAVSKMTQELQRGVGDDVKSMQSELFKALSGLNALFDEGARPSQGRVGGPTTVHPGAFKAQIEALKEKVKTSKAQTPEEEEALAELNELLGQLVPAYEAYIGAGVHYPSSENETIRYVNAEGNEITKEQFEQLKTDFKAAVENTTEAFLEDASKRIKAVMTNVFSVLEETMNTIRI